MTAQGIFREARVTHVRELNAEIDRLKAENALLRDENAAFRSHFHLAVLAAADLARLPPGGVFHLIDGWNLILGAQKEAKDPKDLLARTARYLDEHPADAAWVVFDGPEENVRVDGRLRVSYTGGAGAHRADRFICDFLRMARFAGLSARIRVHTRDKDLLKTVARLLPEG